VYLHRVCPNPFNSNTLQGLCTYLAVAVLYLVLALPVVAQENSDIETVEVDSTDKRDLSHLYKLPIRDYKHVIRETGKFSMKEWKGLYIVGTTSIQFMLFFDKPIDQWIKKRSKSPASVIWRQYARIGHTYDEITPDGMLVALTATTLGLSLITNDSYHSRTAGMLLEAQLITTLATSISKHSFGRSRPYITDNPLEFDPFTFHEIRAYIDFPRGKDPRNSFASGHTSSIFAMLTVISNRYDEWYIRIPAYTYAVSVGVNRMNNPSHWASDVIFGAMIGWYIGQKISDSERLSQLEKKAGVQITPSIGEFGPSLKVSF